MVEPATRRHGIDGEVDAEVQRQQVQRRVQHAHVRLDAGQDDLSSAGFQGSDDLVKIGARIFNTETAETVVAAELYDDDCRLHVGDAVDALDAILRGVAADPLVDDSVLVSFGVEIGLKIVWVAFARLGSQASG